MNALTRLRLSEFRNYRQLDLALDGRHVCLFGPNGAGKTNLIEAVSQLGPGRGLRSASLEALTRKGAEAGWAVSAVLDGRRIGVGLERAGAGHRRAVRIDGENASSGDVSDLMRVVWLTPAMDSVFRGSASDRRRFFDRQVMAHRPGHGQAAARYEKAMRERNALLERPHVDRGWADAIEARMAEAGAEMALARAAILIDLQAAVDARPEGAFPKADLTLEGEAEALALDGAEPDAIAAHLAELYATMRGADQRAGRTLKGPHRSDLGVVHRPTAMPAKDASTGQQKALLIGLILASAGALARRADGPAPFLLLDEAAAHLDTDRRAALYDEICALPGQAWLTGTEASLFEAFAGRAQRVEVTGGVATPVS
ncbi:MAG: DNA replication/repair protein RecF [Pseudomonadota bacterium]